MNNIKNIIIALLIIIVCCLGYNYYKTNKQLNTKTDLINSENVSNGETVEIYNDIEISDLKKLNRELYDSIKSYKNEIDYLIKFTYNKLYKVDTVYIKEPEHIEEIKTFNYTNTAKNDTLSYNLTIGSSTEPNWYKIDFNINENFIIVNRKVNEVNKTTITTNNATVDDVVIVKTKQKTKFLEHFHVGPSVTAGYSLINHEFDVTVGIGITYSF